MKARELVIVCMNKLKKGIDINIHSRMTFETLLKCEEKGKIQIHEGFHARRGVTVHAVGGHITIAKNVFLNENVKVVSHKKIEIGENVTIGPNTVIYDHDYRRGGFISKEIKIGDGTWIGANVVILKGICIGNNSVVAAGTILTKDIPDNSIVYGESKLVINKK